MAVGWFKKQKMKIRRDLRRRPRKYPSPANLAKEAVYELVNTETRKEAEENRSWYGILNNTSRVKTVIQEPGNPGSTEPLLENSYVERKVVRTRFKNQDGSIWVKETKYQPRPIPETKPITKQVFLDSPRSEVGRKLYEVRLSKHSQSIAEFTKGPEIFELRGVVVNLYFKGGTYILIKKGVDTLTKKSFNHRSPFMNSRERLQFAYEKGLISWLPI